MTFRLPITVRSYELDALGHVNHAVYHQYAEVARMAGFAAAGCDWNGLSGRAPVLLSTTVHFRRELRANETVEVTCEVRFGQGKSFAVDSLITKADHSTAAEVHCVVGLMELTTRRLLPDPLATLLAAGFTPDVLAPTDPAPHQQPTPGRRPS